MRPETTLIHNGTEYSINLENPQHPHAHDKDPHALNKTDYIHWSEDFNLYFLISYKTHNTELLDITVHDYGKEPVISAISVEEFDREGIKEDVENKIDYTLSNGEIDGLADCYAESGVVAVGENYDDKDSIYKFTDSGGVVGVTIENTLEGWDYLFETELSFLDPTEEVPGTVSVGWVIFNAVRDNAPSCGNFGDHGHKPEYVARLEFPEPEAWQLRALELSQYSVFGGAPELCKAQALREDGFGNIEIAEKLGKHRSTISRQLTQIDEKISKVQWTAENVSTN